jgi:hypothetical protein
VAHPPAFIRTVHNLLHAKNSPGFFGCAAEFPESFVALKCLPVSAVACLYQSARSPVSTSALPHPYLRTLFYIILFDLQALFSCVAGPPRPLPPPQRHPLPNRKSSAFRMHSRRHQLCILFTRYWNPYSHSNFKFISFNFYLCVSLNFFVLLQVSYRNILCRSNVN